MIDKSSSLPEILDHVWGMLQRGNADKKHPYHYPALATYGSGGIQQRIVVLRQMDRENRTLMCYSDARTQKIDDMTNQASAHWLFYDHGSKEQIRAETQVSLHHQDERALAIWKDIPPSGRADYLGPVAPGTHTQQQMVNLPEDFQEEPTEENTQRGVNNFVVIASQVTKLDFLKLMRDGHLRAQFVWEQEDWKGYWTAP